MKTMLEELKRESETLKSAAKENADTKLILEKQEANNDTLKAEHLK